MKRLMLLSTVVCSLTLSACTNSTMPVWRNDPAAPVQPAPLAASAEPAPAAAADGTPIETVPFRLGSSSVTVENMAKQQSCTGGRGAALMTEPGIIEVYRMLCDDGRVFRAKCDMHQCKPM